MTNDIEKYGSELTLRMTNLTKELREEIGKPTIRKKLSLSLEALKIISVLQAEEIERKTKALAVIMRDRGLNG